MTVRLGNKRFLLRPVRLWLLVVRCLKKVAELLSERNERLHSGRGLARFVGGVRSACLGELCRPGPAVTVIGLREGHFQAVCFDE